MNNDNLTALQIFGLAIDQVLSDGRIHRTATKAKPAKKNGWYVSDPSSSFMAYGDWQTGFQEVFMGGSNKLTQQDIEARNRFIEELEQRRKRKQEKAAIYALSCYQQASYVDEHPYLLKKNIEPQKIIKQEWGRLLVPLYDIAQSSPTLANLQYIFTDGSKRFIYGGQVSGLCCPIGFEQNSTVDEVYICEGIATGFAVNRRTGAPVLAAFNANNLENIALIARYKWPQAALTFAADDDHLTQIKTGINTGIVKASKAASLVNGKVASPPFTLEQKLAGLTDWDDYLNLSHTVGLAS